LHFDTLLLFGYGLFIDKLWKAMKNNEKYYFYSRVYLRRIRNWIQILRIMFRSTELKRD
jgi:hypothetical protein